MRFDRNSKIGLCAVIAFIVFALFAWQKCSAQTAGSFTMTYDYSAAVDRAMIKLHGADWVNTYAKPQLREAYKNHKNTALDGYKQSVSEVFDESIDPDLLLKSETNTLHKIIDSVAVRKVRKAQQIADSIAAAQTQGSLIIEKDGYRSLVADPTLIGMNIGKALSPRLAFLEGFEDTQPAPAPPSGLPFNEDAFITYVYVVHILAVVGVIAIGYWIYTVAT